MIGKIVGAMLFFAATALGTYLINVLFLANPPKKKRYWDWDATVTFVWYDAGDSGRDYALGKGRYKVRLPNGRHEAARSFGEKSYSLYDCVRVRQHLSGFPPTVPYEIVGPADNCWQPFGRKRSSEP